MTNDPKISDDEIEVEKIKGEPKVRRALEQSGLKKGNRKEKLLSSRDKSIIGVFLIILICAAVFYFLFGWKYFSIRNQYLIFFQKLMVCTIMTMLVLIINRLLRTLFNKKIDNVVTNYNVKRLIDLGAAVLILFIVLSLLFTNWYGAMVSFGIISLVLGLALQNPITSFFAWVYILIRKPYEVGDRIKIGNVTGDVIELGYFDTTLWEFGGDYLSGDHPSGKLIRFANSKVFSEFVLNYSWPLFPYIWNELKFFVSYESDLKFISETAKSIVKAEIGEGMSRRISRYRQILDETPVSKLQVGENASVNFKASENTWIEVIVRFLVEPKQSGRVKNKLFEEITDELHKYPEMVKFPHGNMR